MAQRLIASAAVIFMALAAFPAFAQFAIPTDLAGGWECWSLTHRTVDVTIREQVSSVTVTDEIANPCPHPVEIEYLFPLPPDAAIDRMTLEMNGRELSGRVLDARDARQIYEEIVMRRRDPGLLEYAGFGLYRSSAFPVPPNGTARMTIHYTGACEKDGDLVEFWYPMTTGSYVEEPVGHFRITCDIESAADITTVYSPTVEVAVEHKTGNRVIASYETGGFRPVDDFQLFYEASRVEVGASLFTYWPDRNEDGYYLLLVSPSPRAVAASSMPKDVVVVLDRSGSMSGEKIQQAREAARYVINNLNPEDRFNFIAYNDFPNLCFPELQAATPENMQRAFTRLDHMDASGSTNIYAALDVAMDQCENRQASIYPRSNNRPAYVIFLTDGLPTVGNTREEAILANTRLANGAQARLFAFGVGYDVNVRLLDNLVSENRGRSTYVRPNESIESKVSSLYNRIRNPLLTSVSASLENFATHDDCPTDLGDLFEGDQILRVGRIYSSGGALPAGGNGRITAKLAIEGNLQGKQQCFEYPVAFDLGEESSSNRFVEKLWAVRRVGQLLDEIELHGRVDELVDELIRLSKRYGIVTPYTSFLADERQNLSNVDEIQGLIRKQAGFKKDATSGPQAQADAVARQQMSYRMAPQASGTAKRMGASSQEAYESGRSEEISTIRIVGNETLYKRGDTWQTSSTTDLDVTRDRAKFTVIMRFTEDYFRLVRENTRAENKILAAQQTGEKLLLKLRGILYLIE